MLWVKRLHNYACTAHTKMAKGIHTTHYPPTLVTVAMTNPMKHLMLSVDLSLGHPSPLCLSIEDVLLRRQIATPLCRWPHWLRNLIRAAVLAASTRSGRSAVQGNTRESIQFLDVCDDRRQLQMFRSERKQWELHRSSSTRWIWLIWFSDWIRLHRFLQV